MEINNLIALLGVSGVGKSTLIKKMSQQYGVYSYITPFTTRKLRENEIDKIHISSKEFNRLIENKDVLVPNYIHGNWYGPSKELINKSIEKGKIPIIDWPVDKLENLIKETNNFKVIGIYIKPPSLKELKIRLDSDSRDGNGKRYMHAIKELKTLAEGKYNGIEKIINNKGRIDFVAKKLHNYIINKVGEKNAEYKS